MHYFRIYDDLFSLNESLRHGLAKTASYGGLVRGVEFRSCGQESAPDPIRIEPKHPKPGRGTGWKIIRPRFARRGVDGYRKASAATRSRLADQRRQPAT